MEAARRCSAALLADAPGARPTDQLPGSKLPRLYTGLDRLALPGDDQTSREQKLLARLAPLWEGFSLKEESRSQRGSRRTLRYSATLDERPVWGHQIVMTFNGDQLITLNTDLGPAPKLKRATKSAHALIEVARRRFSKVGRILPQDPSWGIHLTPTEAIEAIELPALSLAEGPIRLRLDGQSGAFLAKVRLSRDLRGLHKGPHQHRLKHPHRALELPFIQKRPPLKGAEGGESR